MTHVTTYSTPRGSRLSVRATHDQCAAEAAGLAADDDHGGRVTEIV